MTNTVTVPRPAGNSLSLRFPVSCRGGLVVAEYVWDMIHLNSNVCVGIERSTVASKDQPLRW